MKTLKCLIILIFAFQSVANGEDLDGHVSRNTLAVGSMMSPSLSYEKLIHFKPLNVTDAEAEIKRAIEEFHKTVGVTLRCQESSGSPTIP